MKWAGLETPKCVTVHQRVKVLQGPAQSGRMSRAATKRRGRNSSAICEECQIGEIDNMVSSNSIHQLSSRLILVHCQLPVFIHVHIIWC